MSGGRMGIQGRLLLTLAIFAVALVGLNLLVVLWHESGAVLDETELRGEALALGMASHARPALLSYDHFTPERTTTSAVEDLM